MRARLSVFLDANVLVPVALTDLLLRMAEAGLLRVTARSGIRAQAPDDFLLDCLELDSARVVHVVLSQVEDARRPPITVDALLGSIARAGAPHFASVVPVHGTG